MNIIEEVLKALTFGQDDKLMHLIYGFLIFNIANLFMPIYYALGVILTLAIGKEIYDYFTEGHTASFLDLIYGVVPSIIQVLLVVNL